MRKSVIKVTIYMLLTILLTVVVSNPASATSWIKMEPNEVINKAQIVVSGQYVIPEHQNQWGNIEGMWVPFDFKVDGYYQGSGKSSIKAAIEQFDVGWVKDHQDTGGKFVLFLHKDKESYWIPVGGPNGMVTTINGKVTNNEAKDQVAYTEYLSKTPLQKPDSETGQQIEQNQDKEIDQGLGANEPQKSRLFVGILIVAGFLLLFKRLRNR